MVFLLKFTVLILRNVASMRNRLVLIILLVGCSGVYGADAADAWEHVSLYEFERAEPIFRKIAGAEKEGTKKWIEATFGLALSLQHKTPPTKQAIDEARSLYLKLADAFPKHKCAPRALMNIARIDELRDYYKDKIDLKSARKFYRKVIEKYPDNPIISEAILRLGQSYTTTFETEQVKQGIKILRDWLKKHPKDKLSGLMYLHLGDVYFYPLKDYRKMIRSYIRADELKGIEPGNEGFIYWRIAYIAHRKVNDRKNAIRYYTKLITEVPTFGRGYQAQLALKEMGAPVPKLTLMRKKSE